MKNMRKIVIALLVLVTVLMSVATLTASAASQPTTLYLTPNANWKLDNARFAAYFFGNGETWVSATDSNGDGIYEIAVPTAKVYPNVIFCRMNPNASANNWNNKWNQTSDLVVPTGGDDGNNHYTVKEGTWDKGGGTWGSINCNHAGKTFVSHSVAPTCTTTGIDIYHCGNCNKDVEEIVDKIAHTVVNNSCTMCNGKFTTVYVDNAAKWASVYLYTWTGDPFVAWPGEKLVANEEGLFEGYIPSGYSNVIFNNGSGTQSADLKTPTNCNVVYNNSTKAWSEKHLMVDGVCAVCGYSEHTHTPVYNKAVEPGCHYIGRLENWYCEGCDTYYLDEACTTATTYDALNVAATGSDKLVHMEAVAPGCHYIGNVEYWVCYDCEQVWTDATLTKLSNIKSVILPALETEATYVPAKAPTSTELGNVEYWFCDKCEQVWTDAALTQLSNLKNVQLAYDHDHSLVHYEEIKPGCHYTGRLENWYCTGCDTYYLDEACTLITNSKSVIVPALETEATYVAAKAPTCYENGNVEYWCCDKCEQVWADAALTQLTNIKNVQIAPAHTNVVHMDAVAPACHYVGNIEYWVCYDCEGVWQDAELTQLTNIKNVILPALETEATHVDAKAPTCYENGNVEYWCCDKCEQVWADAALTQLTNIKNVQIAPAHTNLVHMDAVAPACHYIGNVEYWVCYDCEGVWTNEALTQLSNSKNVILPALGGEVVHVAAKAPTCTENGNVEYWYCEECEQVWTNEALTQLSNIKNVQIGATGHNFVDGECACGENDGTDVETPEVKLNFFQKIWQAILNFFKSIFGGLFGKN